MRPGRECGHAGAAERATKYPGLAPRLQLAWHLIEWACDHKARTPGLRRVPKNTIERVLRLMDEYIIPMDALVYFEHDQANGAAGARRIAAWLVQARPSAITMRDVKRKHWSGLTEQPDVEAAFEYLCTMNWLREQQPDRPLRGRPAARFDVNPNIPRPEPKQRREGAGT